MLSFQSSKLADSLALQRERLYVSTDGCLTFENDESLPALPVPSLKRTLDRYIESIKPFVNNRDFRNTEKIRESFEHGAYQIEQLGVKIAHE